MLPDFNHRKIVVLDTSAFIAGFDPLSTNSPQYSVPYVRSELTTNSLSSTRFKMAVQNGKLRLKTPKAEYVKKIKASSKTAGDLLFLSKADIQVLALALELKTNGNNPQIVTDDYSIQNVANQLGIKFMSLLTFGIRYHFKWMLYCPACFRKYAADYQSKQCEICGTALKRKPSKKKPI